jgi:hypothetical protein
MEVRIGETALAFYEAYNPTDKPVAGQASYNVTPYTAGAFFEKIDCFCFTEQVLAPGERVQMPVSFYVDQKWCLTAMGSLYIPSHCLIRFTKLTCPKAMPPSIRPAPQQQINDLIKQR